MDRRLKLQQLLKTLATNVYFQPPSNLTMVYPAIVYERDYADTEFANNGVYRHTDRYQVTVIDKNPDSTIRVAVAKLPQCTFQRHFAKDQLNHDIFNLYY